jgi:hypothetical protein
MKDRSRAPVSRDGTEKNTKNKKIGQKIGSEQNYTFSLADCGNGNKCSLGSCQQKLAL